MLSSIKPKNRTIIMYLLIPVAMFIFTVFVPLVTALAYSFFEWKGGPQKTFTGLQNYITLFHDSTFWQAFGHNLYLVVACLIGQIGIAFILVMLVNSKLAKLKGMHRTFGFFPSTISAVCLGLIWNMIYHNKYGLINWFLRTIGREDLCQVWLNNTKLVMLLVSIPLIWQYIGYYMVIMFSAIAGIDTEIFESAEIDGANGIQRALYITLPLIKNTLLVCVTLCVAGNMKAFDNIFVMTKGGPGTASMVMAMYGYQVSFNQSNMGYGSCISVAIFVLSLLVIGGSQGLVKWITREKEA
ncbi:MAG: sugar ABC transporter permease [Fusicatenibacter sp.]|nr:sugar ABC transporter permease [Lachnospiraceae bacterium]MDY2937453.1 sugar ABC transporter permease [Fusicatenibacter sp.]